MWQVKWLLLLNVAPLIIADNRLVFRHDGTGVDSAWHEALDDDDRIHFPKGSVSDERNRLPIFYTQPEQTPRNPSGSSRPQEKIRPAATNAKQARPQASKKPRLCERKYAEYVERIFGDDADSAADASDTELDGRVLASPGEYPHMTAIGFEGSAGRVDYKCGGSLISELFVVTAAHCTNITGMAPTQVRIGDLNLLANEVDVEPQVRQIARIHNHPNYTSTSFYNDIALLRLDEEVNLTEFVRPIRLWVRAEIPRSALASAMGYGSTAFGKAPTNRLTHLNLTIVPNGECNVQLAGTGYSIIDSQICAKDFLMNRDTCQGDSGGPLQLSLRGRRRRNRYHCHLIGITSYGIFCRSQYPSINTRTYSFLDWIESITWESMT